MNIVFVGIAGVFKQNRALDSRLRYFAQLLAMDNSITVINRYSSLLSLTDPLNVPQGVDYYDIIKPRNSGHLSSKFLMLLSILIEPFVLLYINKKKRIDIIHIYTEHFYNILFYRLFSRIISTRIVCQYVEYSSFFKHKNLFTKINCILYDKYMAKLSDGVIPISVFLNNKIKEVNPRARTLIVKPLCDFTYFEHVSIKHLSKPYLLYCGSVAYYDAIELISKSFNNSLISEAKEMVFVLSGNKDKIELFKKNHPNYLVLSNLDYDELISYYKGAYALLIPLQNKITDIARFPNKVGEYLAAKGLVITTDVGEMSYLFKDGINAIMAHDFDTNQFATVLNKLETGEYNLELIIHNAYQLGLQQFDLKSYRTRLNEFLRALL